MGAVEYKHLKRLGLSVLREPMEDLAKYADPFLVENVGKLWVGEQVLTMGDDVEDLDHVTITKLGNLAYVGLNHSDEQVRKKAISLIDRVKTLAGYIN